MPDRTSTRPGVRNAGSGVAGAVNSWNSSHVIVINIKHSSLSAIKPRAKFVEILPHSVRNSREFGDGGLSRHGFEMASSRLSNVVQTVVHAARSVAS